MKIEHVAFNVSDPVTMAQWYEKNLGMRTVRSGGPPVNARFVADASGSVMIEIYNNPKAAVPDYRKQDPLILHLAFHVDDVAATRQRLLAAGATPEGDVTRSDAGDDLAMVRDPWGFPVQLVRRAKAMI
jgi:catechol 2,3-dioxygenase-like lactoylglutathione lyase family enzyme